MPPEPRPPRPASAADPRVAAVFDEMEPYAATVAAIGIFGAPTEAVVPIVRRLRGRTGVSTGPGAITLVNGLVGLWIVHVLRRDPARWARMRDRRPPRWLALLPLHLLLSPVVAARWERAVVLRGRSPLWGGLVSPIGWLRMALLAVTVRRARQAKRSS